MKIPIKDAWLVWDEDTGKAVVTRHGSQEVKDSRTYPNSVQFHEQRRSIEASTLNLFGELLYLYRRGDFSKETLFKIIDSIEEASNVLEITQ